MGLSDLELAQQLQNEEYQQQQGVQPVPARALVPQVSPLQPSLPPTHNPTVPPLPLPVHACAIVSPACGCLFKDALGALPLSGPRPCAPSCLSPS